MNNYSAIYELYMYYKTQVRHHKLKLLPLFMLIFFLGYFIAPTTAVIEKPYNKYERCVEDLFARCYNSLSYNAVVAPLPYCTDFVNNNKSTRCDHLPQ